MENNPKWHRFRPILLGLLVGAYLLVLYKLNVYKYQSPTNTTAIGIASANGKSIFVVGAYSLICTLLILGITYAYTQNKTFTILAGKVFAFLYVLLGILFFIEKFVSKTLLPDRVNSEVEMLICYPIVLVLLLVGYKLHKQH